MICLKRLDRGWRRWTRSRGGPRDTLRSFGRRGRRRKPSRTAWRGCAGSSHGIPDAGEGTWAEPKSRLSSRKQRNRWGCPTGRCNRRATPSNCTMNSSGGLRWHRGPMTLCRYALHRRLPLRVPGPSQTWATPRMRMKPILCGTGKTSKILCLSRKCPRPRLPPRCRSVEVPA